MKKVFAELRAAKFNFPREWGMDRKAADAEPSSRKHDPALDVEAQPPRTNFQDTEDIAAGVDWPAQQRYRLDAVILGLDLLGKPATPVYRQIRLPNYAGPDFRSAMAIVDAAYNYPLILTADKVVVDSSAEVLQQTSEVLQQTSEVLQQTPKVLQQTPEVLEQTPEVLQQTPEVLLRTNSLVMAQRNRDLLRMRWFSARNAAMLETRERRRRIWRRTKRFVGCMFCCGV